jgi:hypothetical protein
VIDGDSIQEEPNFLVNLLRAHFITPDMEEFGPHAVRP